jgi:hypothetical protein
MKRFFQPNLDRLGRRARLVIGLVLLFAASIGFFLNLWAGVTLSISAAFVLFEAARGWCLLRACGIKTRL